MQGKSLDDYKKKVDKELQKKNAAQVTLDKAKEQMLKQRVFHDLAYGIYSDAKKEVKDSYADLNAKNENYRQTWDDFEEKQAEIETSIKELEEKRDYEQSEADSNFALSKAASHVKKGTLASKYAKTAHEHVDRRNELNEEIAELHSQLREAKRSARENAPLIDANPYHDALGYMKHWQKKYHEEKEIYNKLKSDYEEALDNYQLAVDDYEYIKNEYEFRLEIVNVRRKFEQNWLDDAAGIGWNERNN